MKVKELLKNQDEAAILFEDGTTLSYYHSKACYEHHYLSFEGLTMDDFKGLDFDLSGDHFFERIKGYGIALKPTNGYPVRIPGYGHNNSYYSEDLDLILTFPSGETRTYDITDCQVVTQ